MSQWYVAIEGREFGPLTSQELKNLVRSGKIPRTAHARTLGGKWYPVTTIKGLEFPLATPAPPVPVPQKRQLPVIVQPPPQGPRTTKHEVSVGSAFKAGLGVSLGIIIAPILFSIGVFAVVFVFLLVIGTIGTIATTAIQPRPEPTVQRPQESPGIPPGFVRYKDGRILRKEIADGLEGPHIAIPEEVSRRTQAEKIDAALRDDRGP